MYHVIINPGAASGKGRRKLRKVLKLLKQCPLPHKIYAPGNKAAVISLVNRLTAFPEGYAGEACHLLVLGGDGTLNLVLQGILSFRHTTLSCIPCGSGNDFARNMKLQRDPEKALAHLINSPEERLLDYGLTEYRGENSSGVQSRRFLISSGIGYDADICEEANRSGLKKVLNRFGFGKPVYLMIGLKQLLTRRNPGAVLSLDGGTEELIPSLFFLTGMLHPCEGGGVPFCPGADPQDGLLDVCLIRNLQKKQLLPAIILLFFKKHGLLPCISLRRCRTLTLRVRVPQRLHTDGEADLTACLVTMSCRRGLRFLS